MSATDAAQTLADLIEISSQIEGAVLLGPDGAVAASTYADRGRGERVAAAALELVRAADEVQAAAGRPPLTQLVAETADGAVFCVREGDAVVAAVTVPEPTAGLVLYDLRSCLRLAAAEEASPKKPARRAASSRPKKPAAKSASPRKKRGSEPPPKKKKGDA